ncbi:MAG: hypothetical protein IVW57_00115 [Ktedonobacterales bacterium]|nr:hypothetical protein [Ktedonobacterales bacterium]
MPRTTAPTTTAPTTAPTTTPTTTAPTTRRKPTAAPSPTLAHVHETREDVAVISETPPHPPREETPEYAAAHHFLVYEKKAPCDVCGVTVDTLHDPQVNVWKATALETHHWPIERSFANACDPLKVHRDFPSVYNRVTLMQFVDSPANLKVLCSTHHRSVEHGIHHLLPAQFAVQKYLLDGYLIAATTRDATQVRARDDQIMQAAGMEPAPAPAPDSTGPATATATPPAAAKPVRGRASSPSPSPSPRPRPRRPKQTAPTGSAA